jgi:hypothetical protein
MILRALATQFSKGRANGLCLRSTLIWASASRQARQQDNQAISGERCPGCSEAGSPAFGCDLLRRRTDQVSHHVPVDRRVRIKQPLYNGSPRLRGMPFGWTGRHLLELLTFVKNAVGGLTVCDHYFFLRSPVLGCFGCL